MKKIIIISIISIILMGCDILRVPISLIQELIPLAIRYAPYALMFLEAPECSPENLKEYYNKNNKDNKIIIDTQNSLYKIIKKEINKNSRIKKIIAINLKTLHNIKKYKNKKIIIVYYNIKNKQNLIKLYNLLKEKNIKFYTNGILYYELKNSIEKNCLVVAYNTK